MGRRAKDLHFELACSMINLRNARAIRRRALALLSIGDRMRTVVRSTAKQFGRIQQTHLDM